MAGSRNDEIHIGSDLVERLRFLTGLYGSMDYVVSKRFDLSSATSYVLFERIVGLKAEYVEVLLGTSVTELLQVLEATDGHLLDTSYPKLTRFVLVDASEETDSQRFADSKVVLYQEFLDTVVDSRALAAKASERDDIGAAPDVARYELEGDLLNFDPAVISFELRHVANVTEVLTSLCQRDKGNLLVIGTAGTGKTRLLTTMAKATVTDGRYRFFLDLADRLPGEELEELVVRQLGSCFLVPHSQIWSVFTFLIRSGRCVCFVDALDEAVEGGSLSEIVELFGTLSILLSAASTTIISTRQSFLLDTPYVRQLLDRNALISEKLANRLISEGVDPLSLPKFAVLRIAGIADQDHATPLDMMLQRHDSKEALVDSVLNEIDRYGSEIGIPGSELMEGLGPKCLKGSSTVGVLDVISAFGLSAFEASPTSSSCRLKRLLAPLSEDRLRFRHQVFREAIGAWFYLRYAVNDEQYAGVRLTDQCREFHLSS